LQSQLGQTELPASPDIYFCSRSLVVGNLMCLVCTRLNAELLSPYYSIPSRAFKSAISNRTFHSAENASPSHAFGFAWSEFARTATSQLSIFTPRRFPATQSASERLQPQPICGRNLPVRRQQKSLSPRDLRYLQYIDTQNTR
jgi:hypothetical protein